MFILNGIFFRVKVFFKSLGNKQEVLGANPHAAESVGHWLNYL